MSNRIERPAGDFPFGPVCYNPGAKAAMVAGQNKDLPTVTRDQLRAAEVHGLFHQVRELYDQCLAGGHTAADFRQAVLTAFRG